MDREHRKSWPESIGPYRIEGPLGAGGMGEVYRGYDAQLERPVALKRIKTGTEADEKVKERFRREAKAIARLNHASIVQIYGWLEGEDGDWYVMEMVEGRPLRDLLAVGTLSLGHGLRIARDIASGLAAAHEAGIVHRDLKAENVMVTASGDVKILDFGLAQTELAGEEKKISVAGQLVGTISAMSPEQASGETVDHRSDLFALGTLLYEITTGISPFDAPTTVATLTRICTYDPPPAGEIHAGVPDELSALISRLLEKSPSRRPQSAQEVVAALDRIAAALSTSPDGVPFLPSGIGHPSWERVLTPSSGDRPRYELSSDGTMVKTLLLCDLVRSTRLVERLGDTSAARLFLAHDRLARDLLARHEGREIDKSDGFLLLFERPLNAVLYALAYHRALVELSREQDVELAARVGIHVGEVVLHENTPGDVARGAKPLEVEGLAKSAAARLMSLAGGRQTLISRGVFDMARRGAVGSEMLPDGLRWEGHGRYLFKGFEEPVEVFEVGVEGQAPFEPPLGSEKVRRVADDAEDRVRRPLELGLLAAVAVVVALVAFLLYRQQAAPRGVKMRPTIAVLGFENLTGRSEDEWISTAMTELFTVQMAAGEDLQVIPGESVARMKLELSLSGSRTLSEETLDAVHRNLRTDYVLLGSYLLLGEPGAARQLSIQPVLQSTVSGNILAAPQQEGGEGELMSLVSRAGTLLRAQLGFREISAQQAQKAEAAVSSNPTAARLYFEGLEKLRRQDALGARELLEQAVVADPGHALAHAALSQAWSVLGYDQRAAESALRAFELRQGLPREQALLIEGSYYEATSEWTKAIQAYRALWSFFPDNVEYGLRLAGAEWSANQSRESLTTVQDLRSLPAPASDDPRIDLREAEALATLSDYPRQLEVCAQAVKKAREQKARSLEGQALYLQALASFELGKLDQAEAIFDQSIALFSELGLQGKVAMALSTAASVYSARGDYFRVEANYRQALAIVRQTGDRKWISTLLQNLAVLYRNRGDLAEALELFEESLTIAQEIGAQGRVAMRRNSIGWVLLKQGDLAGAESMAREALAAEEQSGRRDREAWNTYLLGRIAFAAGRLEEARDWYERTSAIVEETGFAELVENVLAARMTLSLAAGDVEAASRLLEESGFQLVAGERKADLLLAGGELLLAQGRPAEAEELVRQANAYFSRGGMRDDALRFDVVLARALLAQGKHEPARTVSAGIRGQLEQNQSPEIRLAALVEVARIDAGNDAAAAAATLADVEAEARRTGLAALELEARLAAAEVRGRADELTSLAAEAESRGFGLLARRARAALAPASPGG